MLIESISNSMAYISIGFGIKLISTHVNRSTIQDREIVIISCILNHLLIIDKALMDVNKLVVFEDSRIIDVSILIY